MNPVRLCNITLVRYAETVVERSKLCQHNVRSGEKMGALDKASVVEICASVGSLVWCTFRGTKRPTVVGETRHLYYK